METASILIRTNNTMYVVPFSEIVRCEASSNYTRFYFTNKQPLLVAKTMREYEEALISCNFIRIHNSDIVNRAYIDRVEQNGIVLLKDGSRLIVSKRRKRMVKQLLLNS